MLMNRRELFRGGLSGAAWLSGMAGMQGTAQAQGTPVDGKDYVTLSQPVQLSVPAGQIEVIEFFWYGCPHCLAFEPMLQGWLTRLPADVAFRKVPVAFSPIHQAHQRLYYAMEAMGATAGQHLQVFLTIQRQRRRLTEEKDVVDFASTQGLDGTQLWDLMQSFGIRTKANQAAQLSDAYRIDGVPALGVQGRWYTSAALTGGHDRALHVADWLVQRARIGR